jgi:hypothetical protein
LKRRFSALCRRNRGAEGRPPVRFPGWSGAVRELLSDVECHGYSRR